MEQMTVLKKRDKICPNREIEDEKQEVPPKSSRDV